jgi:hypothetical protein
VQGRQYLVWRHIFLQRAFYPCNIFRIVAGHNLTQRKERQMERYHSQIPLNAKAGEYARFDALGRFIRMESYLSDGLGLIFQIQPNGELRRVFF